MEHHHVILLCYPVQSHINAALGLADVLTALHVRVTFSTAVSGHRRLIPDVPASLPHQDPSNPLLLHHPYSDGYDDALDFSDANFRVKFAAHGSASLLAIAAAADQLHPPTCILYALLFPWVPPVAASLGIPAVMYWIQPAATFALHLHYTRGNRDRIVALAADERPSAAPLELPGLPPLRRADLPSHLVGSDALSQTLASMFEETLRVALEGGDGRPSVLVNTFRDLESDVVEAVSGAAELVPVGPVVRPGRGGEPLERWLDAWGDGSVVYVAFGSAIAVAGRQREELARALVGCGRPFVWVEKEREGVGEAGEVERGRVVGWCEQPAVLAHRAVGCFVTHHGWSSTLEAVWCGVPVVGMPQAWDQTVNARMAEAWGLGVRARVGADGVVEEEEVRRCLEAVMGEEGKEIRRRVGTWRDRAREAVAEGGSSDRDLRAFLLTLAGAREKK